MLRRVDVALITFIIVLLLLLIFPVTFVYATVKEVKVWGAQSINQIGSSDNKVDIEEIEKDYKFFNQTDGLREYFIDPNDDSYKEDLTEALSWLIDNEIIVRDELIRVSNVNNGRVPLVSISKIDVSNLLSNYVNRSDAIMYIYKGVFGPIDARTVGIETPNVRVDNGVKKTLMQMMIDHDYFNTVSKSNGGTISQSVASDGAGSTGGINDNGITYSGSGSSAGNGTNGIEIIAPGYHYDEGGNSSISKGASGQGLGFTVNLASTWRYTPQGTKYESIFGDTNIFISDVNINQDVNSGNGSVSTGSHGGGGVGGNGGNNAAIQYETDYKQIYYTPGADIMFYRANDCLELYLRAALNKGLLQDEIDLRTDKFTETILNTNSNDTVLEHWSSNAYPYIFNRYFNKLVMSSIVKSNESRNILGVNYNLNYSNGVFTIDRKDLFDSNSGYFTTEKMYKITVYRYIYRFINANEKKLSNLESDIVNYKYGMQLEGCTSSDEDTEIVKYLIAKGILNFDGVSDFQNLYSAITYDEFIPILYRAANPNARLDFSLVQLTDSETAWRAKGYSPQTTYVVSGNAPSIPVFEYDDQYAEDFEEEVIELSYNNKGDLESYNVILADLLNTVSSIRLSDTNSNFIMLGLDSIGKAKITTTVGDAGTEKLYFDYEGIKVYTELNSDIDTYFSNMTAKLLDLSSNSVYTTEERIGMKRTLSNNIWVLSFLKNETGAYSRIINCINSEISKLKETDSNSKIINYYNEVKSNLEHNMNNDLSISEIRFAYYGGNAIQVSPVLRLEDDWKSNLKWITGNVRIMSYKLKSDTGEETNYIVEFPGSDGVGLSIDDISVINEVAKEAQYLAQCNNLNVEIKLVSDYNETNVSDVIGFTLNKLGLSVNSRALQQISDNQIVIEYFKGSGASGKDAFYSWSGIEKYNNQCTDINNKINIFRESDLILYNKDTDTRAFFRNENPKVAIVGTTVVDGDPVLGVAFKEGEGTSAEYYYYGDAIKLLMDAKQESLVLSGIRAITLSPDNFNDNISKVQLKSLSGHIEGGVTGIKALVARSGDSRFEEAKAMQSVYDFESGSNLDTYWGNYLSLSLSNRSINAISRKISYKVVDSDASGYAYAVVIFKPCDIEETGTANINSKSTMQELLDAAVKPPSTESGKAKYDENMARCNAFANWIYGTTGGNYIQTGYLEPEVYLFYFDYSGTSTIPNTIWGSLPKELYSTDSIKRIPLVAYTLGSTLKLNDSALNINELSYSSTTSYFLSKDFKALVIGDRVYLEDSLFINLNKGINSVDNSVYYSINNGYNSSNTFGIGSTFRLRNTSSDINELSGDVDSMRAMVISTSSNGNITCQYGPLIGTPIFWGNQVVICDLEKFANNNGLIVNLGKSDTKITNVNVNLLRYVTDVIFKTYEFSYSSLDKELITKNPVLSLSSGKLSFLFNGEDVLAYDKGTKATETKVIKVPNYANGSYDFKTYKELNEDLRHKVINAGYVWSAFDSTETYLTFSFDGTKYSIEDGYLVKKDAQASDYLSASLFTNINDLVINSMINESNGAIPINEVPDGSLLKVGSDYYCAVGGSSEDKKFVGYTHLSGVSTASFIPKVQDAVKSFANHFVLGGNQYINITHYFDKFTVLSGLSDYLSYLDVVTKSTMSSAGAKYICIDSSGNSTVITDGNDSGDSHVYAPCEIIFQNILLAYPATTLGNGTDEVKVYYICNMAANSVIGAIEDLPIFVDNVLDVTLSDRTTSLTESNYVMFEGAFDLLAEIKAEFLEGYNRDLFTLLRFILFIVLVWLLVSSWLCFGFRFGGLMPIIDAIKYPTRDRSANGLDLFKLISLGTISVETEFTFGRFLQYNLVLLLLITIVWKTEGLL